MALAKDMKPLSEKQRPPEDHPPDQNPRFAPVLAQAWADLYAQRAGPEKADDAAPIRHSWAGMCARKIGYELTDTTPSNPISLADQWRFGIGSAIHEWWQRALQVAYPDSEIEFTVTLGDKLTSGHGDALVRTKDPTRPPDAPPWVTAIELKTINGFGFKASVGARGAAQGPRHSAKLQGALNALGVDADELVVVYAALELLSPREAEKLGADAIGRFCAEWSYPRSVYVPFAEAELERLALINADVQAGVLPERTIADPELPAGAVVTDPDTGRWELREVGSLVDAGKTWHCAYCPFQDRCASDAQEGL